MNEFIHIQNKDGQMVVSSREVAQNFEKNHRDVLESIRGLIRGCAENSADLFIKAEYQNEQNKQMYPEYLLTRDGFSLLVMGFTGEKALEWKLKYIEAFNAMEKSLMNLKELSPELQLLINMELKQKAMEASITATNERIDHIQEIVRLDSQSWRTDAKKLIVGIARKMGGVDYIRDVNQMIYKYVDARMQVKLHVRLTNMRRRMAEQGVSASRRDKLNYLDVIAEDKKLIEGYVAIVKEMAVKYGVPFEKAG